MSTKLLPISLINLVTVDKIPLSMCCIGGIAININFVQCSYGCPFCPWEANLDLRSANIVSIDEEKLSLAVHRYKPELMFFNGSDFWLYENVEVFIQRIARFDVLKGVKVIVTNTNNISFKRMMSIAEVCDIVLVEVNRFSDTFTTSLIIEKFVDNKHVEVVVVGENLGVIKDKIEELAKKFSKNSIYIPINLVLNEFNEIELYNFIDRTRSEYPLIHTLKSRSSEYSTILCRKCLNPVVVRQGDQLLKISIDRDCRCKYCGVKVINSGKSVCIARKFVKVPINILLT